MVVIGEKNYTKRQIDEIADWLGSHHGEVIVIGEKNYTKKQIDEIANYLGVEI